MSLGTRVVGSTDPIASQVALSPDWKPAATDLYLQHHEVNCNFIFMREITMLQFRRDSKRALAAMRRGESLLLTHRGRPVARLEPVRAAELVGEDDPIRLLEQFAVDGPGGDLKNVTIDEQLYGG